MDWNDVRHLLALSRTGTLAGAARRLRVDATTVRRRLDALERELGATLAVRTPEGWRLTEAGARAAEAATTAEAAMTAVERAARGDRDAVVGRVRVTTVEVLATRMLAPLLPDLHARHPGLELDILTANRVLDLVRGEADLALRPIRPTQAGLRGRRVASVAERPHAARSWLDARGIRPDDLTDLDGREVCVLLGTGDRWLAGLGAARPVLRTSSATVLYDAVRRGLGVGLLPDVVAARDARLVPLPALGVERARPLWLVVPEGLADVARVRAVLDFLVERLPAVASPPQTRPPSRAGGPDPTDIDADPLPRASSGEPPHPESA